MQEILFRQRVEIAIRYFWYRFKLLIRQNVGVDKNFFCSDAALRLSNGVLPKGTRITCTGRTDGLGMQALARMSGLNFAKNFGATYVDAPFAKIGHAPGAMSDWIDAWEQLFNFSRGEERLSDADYVVVDYSDYLRNKVPLSDKVVLRFQQCYWLHRRYPDSFEVLAPSLREKCGLPEYRDEQDDVIVAVHVRRGDVSSSRNSMRFTPNKKILKSIENASQALRNLNKTFQIEIHSQGKPSEFKDFADIGCRLHLDTDAVWTMRKLIEADMLIMSKSSFSYVAGVVNRGVKVYEPTFNPPQSAWIIKRRDGGFDIEATERRLRDYFERTTRPAQPQRMSA